MALDWDTLFNPQSTHMPNEQWSDLTLSSTSPHAPQMPKPTSNNALESTLEDATRFDSLLDESIVDPLFSDSLFIPNEYFLSDLDALQSFENLSGDELTTGSYSEPQVDTDQYSTAVLNEFDPSLQMFTTQEQDTLCQTHSSKSDRKSTLSISPVYEFLENISSLNGQKSSSTSPKASNERLTSTRDATKRNRNKPDILSACWTSPLCPNHDQNGPPPDPSTCGGGCAPFLFANDDNLPNSIINNRLAEPQEVIAEDGVVEVHPRPKRRSGSDRPSTEKPDVQLSKPDTPTPPASSNPRIKSDSPESTQATTAEDTKQPASRRRLPHNQVERKYRESLNTQLESLRRVVPSLRQPQPLCDGGDMEDLSSPPKPSKAVILASATAYIKQMEKDKKNLADENQMLRMKIKTLQSLIKCDDCSLMQYVLDLKIKQDV